MVILKPLSSSHCAALCAVDLTTAAKGEPGKASGVGSPPNLTGFWGSNSGSQYHIPGRRFF
ncbi:mCG147331 [Mus musculus]|nr:mCG147331 [Mus musculus]